ncbi:MAG: hypothetical protein DMG07_13025 [Acidobacteria bacterium]|nr:MAG: hypothetical protein DMG07_13025 [Acidobacteriota bacterium]
MLASLLAEEGIGQEQPQGIPRRKNPGAFPLSSGQQRLWFLDRLESGIRYNDHFNLRLTGPLNTPVLELAIAEILRRHEAMRAVFPEVEGAPSQIIAAARPLALPRVDLRTLPESERMAEAIRLAVEEARTPFNLGQGPLWRFTLLALADDDHLLLITAHHIAIDGWSRGVFLRDLSTLYRAHLAGGSCRFNTRTTPRGRRSGWRPRRSPDNSITGNASWRARRDFWNCRPTIRVLQFRVSAVRASLSRCPKPPPLR